MRVGYAEVLAVGYCVFVGGNVAGDDNGLVGEGPVGVHVGSGVGLKGAPVGAYVGIAEGPGLGACEGPVGLTLGAVVGLKVCLVGRDEG